MEHSIETRRLIRQLRTDGMSYKRIAKTLKIPLSTVRYHGHPNGREKAGARIQRWRKRNPIHVKIHRALRGKIKTFKRAGFKRDNRITVSDIDSRLLVAELKLNPRCYLTGVKIDLAQTKSYQFDHVRPISRGGPNNQANLGLCIAWANRAKGELLEEEFVEQCRLVLVTHGYTVTPPAAAIPLKS
jgi:5-methylcytosine-specific restriction endonuclease McrA